MPSLRQSLLWWATAAALICPILCVPMPLSDPSGNWTPFLPMWDEFSSPTLNLSKWEYSLQWNGRQPGLFSPENVVMGSGGNLELWARSAHRNASWPAGYDNYTTSYLQTTNTTAQGYFEVRSRSGNSSISSSFWLHASDGQGTWTEIDLYESTGYCPQCQYNMSTRQMCSHTHIFSLKGVPDSELPALCDCVLSGQDGMQVCSSGGCVPAPFDFDGDFHTFGLNWNASNVSFFADGILMSTLPAQCLREPIAATFDRETMPGWMNFPPAPFQHDAPYTIDYIRAWKASS